MEVTLAGLPLAVRPFPEFSFEEIWVPRADLQEGKPA